MLWYWAVEDFTKIGNLDLKKSHHHLGPSPMRPNELCTCPHDGATRAQATGCQCSTCRSVRRGRGGIGVASDVVKVKDEDPDTPGDLRGDKVRLGC